MHTEYEVRLLEIDYDTLIQRLEECGAKLQWDRLQKRYVYDFKPKQVRKWIRLRTNGVKSTLTIKDVVSSKIDGVKECEIEVSDFDECNLILNQLGYTAKGYQENRRRQYILNGVEIDIDFWPLIPTYVEIEGSSSEDVSSCLKLLGYDIDDTTTLDVDGIYKKYGYNLEEIYELKLEEDRLV